MQALFPFTKFLPPQLDDRVVVGGAVEQLATAVAAHPLTVVTAPAGSGKTTAVAAWARDAGGPVAWVRMSRTDDAAAAAAAAVLTGVRRVVDGFGTRLDQVLSQAETSASTPHLVTSLINDLGEAASLRLVLDDFHEITSPDCLALFDALADHLPPGNRLVVASRTEPALSLPRRRVRGELAELTLEDLRLDHASIRAVLARDDAVTDGVVASVARATNGWPAAVQLAAAWIAAGVGDAPSEDPMAPIQAHLWRFLAEEVLDAQPEDLRTFLLDTAILDEMTPSVCAHVSTRPDAAALLAEVDRRRLFLTRYTGEGGQVWRYHDLFAAFLRDRLQVERSEQEVAALHRRAADALPVARAVPHLLAAGEHERVARLTVEVAFAHMDPSILSVVVPWIEALPHEVVDRDHRLVLLLAWRDEIRGRGDAILDRLEPLHAHLRAAGDATAAAQVGLELAIACFMLGELDRAGHLLDEALAEPLEGWWRVVALGVRMNWCRERGDWAGASGTLAEALDLALHSDDLAAHRVLASGMSMRLLFANQGPRWVLARTERLAARLAEPGGSASLTALRPLRAGAALLRLDLDTAAHEVRTCLAESRELGMLAWVHQKAEALLLAMSLAAGDHTMVRDVVDEAFTRMDDSPVDTALRHVYAHAALRAAWIRRRPEQLDAVVDLLAEGAGPEERIVRTVAEALRARLAGRTADHVEPLREAEAVQLQMRSWFGVGVPGLERAALLWEAGQMSAALEAAAPTLDAAAEVGAGILLADAVSHRKLLRRCAEAGLHPEVVGAVLAVLDRPAGGRAMMVPGTKETLSPREVEVLHQIARGRSNQEVAAQLFISDATVKSHLTRILRKLGATSRTHAVARARELHML